MIYDLLTVQVRFENDFTLMRQHARQVAALLSFDEMDQARVAAAVSEIARNALNYAGGGTVEFAVGDGEETGPAAASLLISVYDKGPGIPDVAGVLEGRVKPAGAAGLGIVSARRMVDSLEIESSPGRGTRVVLGKRLPRHRGPVSKKEIAGVAGQLAKQLSPDPYDEIRRQNQELLRTLDELRARQEELVTLNRELEDTNRGVVALYAELDEKAMHLREADELKTRFLSNMSHEFRTPLNSIMALSGLLLERTDGAMTEEQVKQVTFIRRSAQDLMELVNDLLDLAKVAAGRTTLNAAEMDVANLLGGLRGMFRPLLPSASVKLIFEEPDGIPKMYTDEGKVSQILRNFISNALKFTEEGEVRVSAVYDSVTDAVRFAVADTGIGIAQEDQARIFEEFAQIDNPIQKRVRGTGLGLPLARKLADLLGGSVTVQSAPGAGSTFTATIPVGRSESRGISQAVPSTEPHRSRAAVLVVEDDPETVLLYERYLRGTAFQAVPGASIQEARRLMNEIRPSAIILDIMLHDGPAWEFLLDLKRGDATRNIPVFVVSVLEEERKARAFGADEYAVKPLDRNWLLTRLQRAVDEAPPPRVLIVDDDETSRYVIGEMLADSGCQLMEASGGCEGLRLAREQLPSAILLDLAMPDMSGFEVLEQLGASPATRGIPVIVVTSKTLSDEERQRLAPAVDVIPKDTAWGAEGRSLLTRALAGAGVTLRAAEARKGPHVH